MKRLKKELENRSGNELAALCSRAALDSKAEDLVVLDVRGISSFTDYFVIMSGRSSRHVQGLAQAVEETMCAKRVSGKHSEGMDEGLWVLLDYEDVVVHIFSHDSRTFYDLEGLWHDAPRLDVQVLLADADVAAPEA
ncbi:MAG: ribosome silencing factor [Desulfobulbus propionicus]|nr:MAG: ribosome silencing factor [Desulfobulbus propionicus]